MPAVQETVDRVRRIDVDQIDMDLRRLSSPTRPHAAVGRYRPLHLGKEERAGLDAGVAAGGLSPLADHEGAGWARVHYPKIDYQDLYYYSAPKKKELASLDEVDPEILRLTKNSAFPCASRKCWPAWSAKRR